MARYALIDKDGTIQNVIEWDGQSAYTPPTGLTLVEEKPVELGDERFDTGAKFVKGVVTPKQIEIKPTEKTKVQLLEERIAALETKV